MGIVYEAVQDYPSRIVALKALKGSLAEPALVKRFQREVNILALLRHPGIGQLFAAGTLEDPMGVRVPFLAMERIHGLPIHQYCRRNRLGVRQRLELFVRVADAVEYVHTTGVIHRDLTCRNILVNTAGEPKVLDFGLATFAHGRHQSLSVATVTGQPFGTFRYVSPEQATGQIGNIDRQTDVYALGVILYKILSGRHPLKLTGATTLEMVRQILETEPARLSHRNRAFRGDLETIAHKALSKRKADRYTTVAELAADIRRYLANQPIAARPQSHLYVAGKFIRRHRVLMTSTLMIVSSLSIGLAAAVHEAVRANAEAQRANAQAVRANTEARHAAIQFANAKVAQGDALVASSRYDEARSSYDSARDAFERVGESPIPAQLATWELDQFCARPVREVLPAGNHVERVAISADHHWLATSQDGLVEVREVATNRVLLQFRLKNRASALVFSPDSRCLAASSAGQCVVYDILNRSRPRSTELKRDIVLLTVSNHAIAMTSVDGAVSVQPFDGDPIDISFAGTAKPLRELTFVQDGRLIAVDWDGQIWQRAFSGGNFALTGVLPNAMENKETVSRFAVSPGSRFVATFGDDECTVFTLPHLKEFRRLPGCGANHLVGFASETSVYMGSPTQNHYQIFDLVRQSQLVLPADGHHVAAFSNNLAAVANQNKPLVLFSVAANPGISLLPLPATPSAGTLSRDGRIAVVGGTDGLIRIYDADTQNLLSTLDAGFPVKIVVIDDAATQLMTAVQNGIPDNLQTRVQFWDLRTFTKTSEFNEQSSVNSVAFGRSGKSALSCVSGRNAISIWNKVAGKWSLRQLATKLAPTDVALSPDERSFLLSTKLGIEWWDLHPEPRLRALLPESEGFSGVLFAQNGQRITAMNKQKKCLKFWSAMDPGYPSAGFELVKPPDAIACTDGRELACLDGDNLYLLDIDRHQILRRLSTPAIGTQILGLSGNGERAIVTQNGSCAMILDFTRRGSATGKSGAPARSQP